MDLLILLIVGLVLVIVGFLIHNLFSAIDELYQSLFGRDNKETIEIKIEIVDDKDNAKKTTDTKVS